MRNQWKKESLIFICTKSKVVFQMCRRRARNEPYRMKMGKCIILTFEFVKNSHVHDCEHTSTGHFIGSDHRGVSFWRMFFEARRCCVAVIWAEYKDKAHQYTCNRLYGCCYKRIICLTAIHIYSCVNPIFSTVGHDFRFSINRIVIERKRKLCFGLFEQQHIDRE